MNYICPSCNESNPKSGGYCRKCGAKLGTGGKSKGLLAGVGVALFAGIAVAAWMLSPATRTQSQPSDSGPSTPAVVAPEARVKLGVAYGTEKADWFKWAAGEFALTPEGRNVELDLKGMGSLEAAQAIVGGDRSIQVWSPASAMYKKVFLRDWESRHGPGAGGRGPIAREAELALTPMVFVMWAERYEAFAKKYGEVSFRAVEQAIAAPEGWRTIAGKDEWGFFKFSHTHPNRSNSGLATLVLMANDYHAKTAALAGRDVTDAGFGTWMSGIERRIVGAASPNEQLSPSTGTLMDWMVRRGASTYDAVFVYESVAIDRLKAAEGRGGSLRVVYPKYNMWNANPLYVLDTPWVSADQRRAGEAFLAFLLSDRVQAQALTHGFRPANVHVPTTGPESPFVRFKDAGLQVAAPGFFCEMPEAEVLENLLLAWQRGR